MKFKDYYEILGVARDAGTDDIKRAYRRLARKYHPDVSKEPQAEQRFKEINEAHAVLSDTEKRAAYDRVGSNRRGGEDFTPPPNWNTEGFNFRAGGFGDAGEFSDFFSSLFGGGTRGARGGFRMQGDDQHAKIRIALEDSYAGATRSLQLTVPEVDAHGRVSTGTRTLQVKVPAGVVGGQQIRLSGQGAPGVGGGPAGDLYLEVELEPHPLFRTQGRDVFLDLPVAPWEAALGATVTVPTLGGNVELKIPAGAQTGQKLRLKGRGLPGATPGDHYAVLQIVNPKADSPAARELYQRMARELSFNPRAHLGV